MSQVPQDDGTGIVCRRGPRLHVVYLAGAKIHLSQHEDRDVIIEGSSELRPIHQPQRHVVAEKLGQPLRNV